MKALAGRGGGFFMGGKRMRGFGLGPPGMDDGRFGFYDGMGAPEFGYPGGRFGGSYLQREPEHFTSSKTTAFNKSIADDCAIGLLGSGSPWNKIPFQTEPKTGPVFS